MQGENSERERYFATRHARPAREAKENDPISKEYADLTERGVDQARERARNDILKLIQNAKAGAVIFIGGTSDQPRTKQTAEIYGDAIAEMKPEIENQGTLVITKGDIDKMITDRIGVEAVTQAKKEKSSMPGQITKVVESLRKMVAENSDKKMVIDYPLMLKELAFKYRGRWTDQKGNKTEYFSEVLKKHGQNNHAAGEDWIANQGRLEVGDRVIQGPEPRQVAEDYIFTASKDCEILLKKSPQTDPW